MVEQFHRNWEEQGNIRIHTFRYDNTLKTEFYHRLGGKWTKNPFVVIGLDLITFRVFFRCKSCLYDSHWERALGNNRQRYLYYRDAALRLYYREVNVLRRRLEFPEKRLDQ